MKRSILAVAITALALGGSAPLVAQQSGEAAPAAQRVRRIPRQELSGPRFGVTAFTGEIADLRAKAGKEPFMTQVGWQFETRILDTPTGNQALLEWVILLGGLEQDEANLSLAGLAGYRLANGVEFGVGPNLSSNKDNGDVTTSIVFAGGATMPMGDIFIPLNLAVAVARGGPRITALVGWIVG